MKKKATSGKSKLGKCKLGKRLNPLSRFSETRLTSRAGLIPMSRFMDKLGVEKAIEWSVTIDRGSNTGYGLGMMLSGIALGIMAGCRHLSDLALLGMDEAFMKTRGWDRFPVLSTITRVLERFEFRSCAELSEAQDRIRQKVWNKKWWPGEPGFGFLCQECVWSSGRCSQRS